MTGQRSKTKLTSAIFCASALALVLTSLPLVEANAAKLNKSYSYAVISPKGKAGIATFRQAYREFLERELKNYEPAVREEITLVFEECLDNSYRGELWASNKLLNQLNDKYKKEPVILWHLAINYFIVARRLPDEKRKEQAKLLRMGFERSEECVEVAQTNPDCWISYAASHGALALAEGIFDTISQISDVKAELLKAHKMLQKDTDRCPMAPWGVDSLHVAIGALSEFNRLAPDWWLFKLISGVRGDKEKSWSYAKQLEVFDLASANIVARSALCHGADSENQALIDKGIAFVAKGMQFELLHPFDESEYRRLARLYNAIAELENPEPDDYYDLGCHEFGNDDKDALEARAAK